MKLFEDKLLSIYSDILDQNIVCRLLVAALVTISDINNVHVIKYFPR